MQFLEQRIPFRAGQLVDIGDRRLGVTGAVAWPSRQQRRHQIGDRPADRLVDVELRGGIFLQLDVLNADHQARDAIGLVDRENPVGELDRLVDIAFGDRGDEGTVEQLVVLRVGAQRRTVKRRSRGRVALHAGMAGGEITARRGQRLSGPGCLETAPNCRRGGRGSAPGSSEALPSTARAKAATVQRLQRMENITVRSCC